MHWSPYSELLCYLWPECRASLGFGNVPDWLDDDVMRDQRRFMQDKRQAVEILW